MLCKVFQLVFRALKKLEMLFKLIFVYLECQKFLETVLSPK